MNHRQVGNLKPLISPIGLGCGHLGRIETVPSINDASIIVKTAHKLGINFLDTAPLYGQGESERRVGLALDTLTEAHKRDIVVNTKVGYRPDPFDYSYGATRICVEKSLEFLGMDQLQMVHIHDVERSDLDTVMNGARRALHELQHEGVIHHVGVSGGPVAVLGEFIETGEFDSVITHNRFNLLDQPARSLLERARQLQMITINAAPFATGLLADPNRSKLTYGYQPANQNVVERALKMETICRDAEIDLATTALRFSLESPLIDITIVGMKSTAEVETAVNAMSTSLPIGLLETINTSVPPNLIDDVEAWRTRASP